LTESPRTFILDTNVLLYDPHALEVFKEHDVVIPMTVIEEIDRFKKDVNETGRNARQTSRMLDTLRGRGSLREGVRLAGGGTLRVDHNSDDAHSVAITWGADSNDNRILQTAVRLHRSLGSRVALVTRDTNMRLKCDALGVVAEDYENAHLQVDEQWTGVVERVGRAGAHQRSVRRRRGGDLGGCGVVPEHLRGAAQLGRRRADGDGPGEGRSERVQAGPAPQGGRVGRVRAQQGAAVRARPAARPGGAARHAQRDGGHRQDPLAIAAGLRQDGGSAALPQDVG
jgi:rRNA-processing protein FCF1